MPSSYISSSPADNADDSKRKRSWAAADDADGRWEVGDGRLVVVARRWGACENVNLERQGNG